MPTKFYRKILGFSGRHWVSIKLFSANSNDKKLKLDSSQ